MNYPSVPEPPVARPETSRITSLDLLRIMGASAVVTLHVADGGLGDITTLSSSELWLCIALDCASRWAVPIFVMVSGALLLDPAHNETPSRFYRRRFRRIGVPYLFWSGFYVGWSYLMSPPTDRPFLMQIVANIFHTGTYYHMHFLNLMLGLYLFVPALRLVTCGDVSLVRLTTIVILALGVGDFVMSKIDGSEPTIFVRFVPFMGYFLAGWCLRRPMRGSVAKTVALALLIASVAGTALIMYYFVTHGRSDEGQREVMSEPFSPQIILESVCLFALIVHAASRWNPPARLAAWITGLSSLTFGVYLVHPVFLDLLNVCGLTSAWHGIWIGVPTQVLVIIAASFAVTWLLQRMKFLRWTLGS
jgi:surface polysaccharide O-acyltransferase-like enzyme